MDGKLSYKIDEPRYRYAQVERALATFFGLNANRQSALRGRLKNFNQLGLPGLKAGKGARVEYSLELAGQWLIALLMTELGLDPTVIAKIIKGQWTHFARWLREAADAESKAGNPVFLTLRLQVMSALWAGDPLESVSVKWVSGFRRKNKKGLSNADVAIDRCSKDGLWLCIRNLTDDLNRLKGYLDATETEAADTASFSGKVT